MPDHWRRRTVTWSSRTGSRRSPRRRAAPPPSWPSGRWTTWGPRATCTTACGMPRPMPPSWPTRPTRAASPPSGVDSWPASSMPPASWPGAPRRPSIPTGATSREAGRPPPSCGARTTAPAASASSVTGPGGASRPGCPGPMSIPTSWWPPASPPASTASTTSSTFPNPSPATPTKRPTCPVSLPPWSKRSASWSGSAVAAEAFGADVHHHLLNTAQQEWEASNRHVSDWELARNFERM